MKICREIYICQSHPVYQVLFVVRVRVGGGRVERADEVDVIERFNVDDVVVLADLEPVQYIQNSVTISESIESIIVANIEL
jgi:hypothetical protein